MNRDTGDDVEPKERTDNTGTNALADPDARTQSDVAQEAADTGFRLEAHNAYLIRLAHQRATQIFQTLFEGHAVTPTQFAVMATLVRFGEMPQNRLSKLTGIDTATLSPMVSRLGQLGHVRRTPSSTDQRVNLIGLTESGARYTLELLPLSKKVSDMVLEPLKPRDRERFIALLAQIIE